MLIPRIWFCLKNANINEYTVCLAWKVGAILENGFYSCHCRLAKSNKCLKANESIYPLHSQTHGMYYKHRERISSNEHTCSYGCWLLQWIFCYFSDDTLLGIGNNLLSRQVTTESKVTLQVKYCMCPGQMDTVIVRRSSRWVARGAGHRYRQYLHPATLQPTSLPSFPVFCPCLHLPAPMSQKHLPWPSGR